MSPNILPLDKKFAVETIIHILIVTFINILSHSPLELGRKRPITEERLKHTFLKYMEYTKDYDLYYAEGGNINNWIRRDNSWYDDMLTLVSIIEGLENFHKKRMVHCDFHIGNILLLVFQSHMGFCGEVGNVVDATKIYGIISYYFRVNKFRFTL